MSGEVPDDAGRSERFAPSGRADADLEMDVQCAIATTSPVLITAPHDAAIALAHRIHRGGRSRAGAFLTLDCARVQDADQIAMIFDAASPNGTVFLRNIGRLPVTLQAQLYRQIVPLGVRIIAATAQNLLQAVTERRFDEALFYRLNQIHVIAPAGDDTESAA